MLQFWKTGTVGQERRRAAYDRMMTVGKEHPSYPTPGAGAAGPHVSDNLHPGNT